MKRFLLALVMVCALALPSVSNAASGMYLAPKFLMTVQNTGTVDRSNGMGGLGMDPYSQFTLGGALVVAPWQPAMTSGPRTCSPCASSSNLPCVATAKPSGVVFVALVT